jgi:hypothetical protein
MIRSKSRIHDATTSMLFAPESRVCKPGDTARQFVVDRVFHKPWGALPFSVWVNPEPVRVRRLNCGCQKVFDLVVESALQRSAGRHRVGLTVCECMGSFIE